MIAPIFAQDSTTFLTVEVARLVRRRFEEAVLAAGLEITTGEARTLAHLCVQDGMRQSVLAERLSVEPMTLTGYLDRLEARGLVRREPDPDDRRAKRVVVEEKAAPLARRISEIARSVREEATRGLGPDEVEALRAALRLMRGNLASARALMEEPA